MNVRVLIIYCVLLYLIPTVFQKPTDIDVVDNVVLYSSTSQQFLISAVLVVAMSLFIAEKYFSE